MPRVVVVLRLAALDTGSPHGSSHTFAMMQKDDQRCFRRLPVAALRVLFVMSDVSLTHCHSCHRSTALCTTVLLRLHPRSTAARRFRSKRAVAMLAQCIDRHGRLSLHFDSVVWRNALAESTEARTKQLARTREENMYGDWPPTVFYAMTKQIN